MQAVIIQKLLGVVLATVSDAILKAIAEAVIGVVREKVVESENRIDDLIVLPLLDKLEVAFELDDDE